MILIVFLVVSFWMIGGGDGGGNEGGKRNKNWVLRMRFEG